MPEHDASTTGPGAVPGPAAAADLARSQRALRLLRGSNRALIHAADEDSLLNEVCRIAVEEGGYRMAMVAFAERDAARSWRPAAYAGGEGAFVRNPGASWAEDSPYGRGPGGKAVRSGQPSVSRDILNDTSLAGWRDQAVQRGYRSVVALPLKSEGQAFGVLAIHSSEVGGFDPEEVGILSELAGNLAFGIVTLRDRAVAQAAQRRLNRELRAISNCNQTLLRARDEQALLDEICRIVCDEAGYEMAWVGFCEHDPGHTIRLVARAGDDHGFLDNVQLSWADSGFGRGPSGTAIRSEQSIWVRDIAADLPAEYWRDRALSAGFRSIIALPLKDDARRTFGVLALYSREVNDFAADERRLLDELAGDLAFGIVVLRARTEQQRLEQQRLATLNFFASMDRIDLALQAPGDLDQVLGRVLDEVVAVFGCDRAWLLYPCAPDAPAWHVPMERTRPETPGTRPDGVGIPMDAQVGSVCRMLLDSPHPVHFGGQAAQPVPQVMCDRFGVRSMLCMAIHPATDRPYMFGLHQCSTQRDWTPAEERLFQEIGRRLADALSSLLAHRELQRSEARLRDSLARERRLVESNVIGVFFWNLSGEISDANEAFLRLLGYSRDELLAGRLMWTALTPPEHAPADALAAEQLRRTGVTAPYEKALLHKDGRRIPVLIGSALMEGSADNGVAFVLDLTERKQAEVEAEGRRAAEASSRAKSEFLSRMSHELRTPLNAVLGFSQLLQADAQNPLSALQLAQLDHIRRGGWHLLALINDLLDVSRIEIGQLQVQNQPLQLIPLLEEALHMTELQARTEGVTLAALARDQSQVWVLADPIRLRQVLINLLSNAVKYNRRGGSVRVAVASDGTTVQIDVIDDGVGLTREQLGHLFEPFNRLGRERSGVQGTGIGLVLTRQLVRLMAGRLDIDSEPGRGTRVRVSLRARQPGDAASAASAAPPARVLPGGTSHGVAGAPAGVVLYIEDNPVNLLLVEQLLARWSGVRLVQAEDGASGIELARSLRPNLVLLDMQLPDLDGFEVLEALRADPATSDLTIVALSASAMPETVARARAAGVNDYWTKPLDFDRFLVDVQRLLAARRPPQ